MAASDAKPVPQKNVAYRITFPILDADGDPVTGATGLDSEVSKDGGTFTDCTNEATEIATSSGVYYLDLTSTEMNADTVAITVKTSSSGAKTTIIVLYPEETGDIRVNVTAFGGTAGTFASGRPEVNTTHWGGTAVASTTVRADLINIAGAAVSTSTAQLGVNVVNFGGSAGTFASGRPAVNASYIGGVPVTATTSITFPSTCTVATTTGAVGSVTGNVGGNVTGSVGSIATGGITSASFAAGAIDAAAIANGAIDAATFAADVDAEILSYIVDDATRIDASALNTATGTTIPAILVDTAEIGVAGAGLTVLATAANLATVAGYLDTEIAAILEDTGTTLPTQIAALNNLSAAQVNAEVDTALADIHLDHLLAVTYDPATKPGAADALLNELVESDAGVARFTANALEQAPTGGSAPTASQIADAVWDELQADHVSAGSFGVIASEIADILTDTADIQPKIGTPTDFGSGTSTLAANLQDLADNGTATYDRATDSLQAIRDRGDEAWITATGFSTHSAADVWSVATRLLTAGTNIVLAKGVGVTGFNDLSAAQVNAEADTALADVGLTTTVTGRIDSAVSTRASQTSVDTVDDFLDTEIAAIKAKTDQLTFTVAGQVDANIQYVNDVQVTGNGETGTEWGPA